MSYIHPLKILQNVQRTFLLNRNSQQSALFQERRVKKCLQIIKAYWDSDIDKKGKVCVD